MGGEKIWRRVFVVNAKSLFLLVPGGFLCEIALSRGSSHCFLPGFCCIDRIFPSLLGNWRYSPCLPRLTSMNPYCLPILPDLGMVLPGLGLVIRFFRKAARGVFVFPLQNLRAPCYSLVHVASSMFLNSAHIGFPACSCNAIIPSGIANLGSLSEKSRTSSLFR